MTEPRKKREAAYVLDLIDELVGQRGQREHRFDWLRGDPGATGRRAHLPVDSYWPDLGLVVEVYERQHDVPVAHFDKPDRVTVSGVHRGVQRRIYDERRRQLIPERGLRLIIVRTAELTARPSGRLLRSAEADKGILKALVADALAAPGGGLARRPGTPPE